MLDFCLKIAYTVRVDEGGIVPLMREEFPMIEVGAEVTGVWGAMEPEWKGVITEILDECVIIRWDCGADH